MEPMYRRLTSPHSDLIIKTHPYAEIVWWGSTLKHFSPDDCISLERPVANGRLDTDTPLTLMAENGAGLFGSPGLEGHRNGLDASPVFRTISVVQAGESLTLTSEDAVAGLRMVSELVLTSSGVLKMRHALTNLREGGHTMRRLPGWMNQTSDISGEWLAQAGIQLPVLDPESAMLIALERLA